MTKARKPLSPNIVHGAALNYNFAVQDRYSRALVSMVKQMTRQTESVLKREFATPHGKEYFAEDANISSSSRIAISKLREKFTSMFAGKSKPLAKRMIDESAQANANAMTQNLKLLSNGLDIGRRVFEKPMEELVIASIAENVSLIKSIPQEYFTDIEGAVMRSITSGNGLADLVPFLKSHEGITVKRARLIAGDQSRKVYSNISAERMKAIKQTKYIWRHSSAAQEPRPLHAHGLNGNIYDLNDPPVIQYAKGKQPEVRGKPGDLINCMCFMQSIIDFSGE